MATLYIVATPIGNLKDISLRALEVLREVDLILCEDTQKTMKLLWHFGIKKRTVSYHQHSKLKKIDYIVSQLLSGKNIALVSEAGTPGISDPGNKLIELIITKPSLVDKVKIVPIPGPSALAAIASIAGFSMDRFLFLGFPPAKRKRKKFFEEAISFPYPVIFYESPYRILKTLKELEGLVAEKGLELEMVIGRELTKKFETIYRGEIKKVRAFLEKEEIRGEFTIILKTREKE